MKKGHPGLMSEFKPGLHETSSRGEGSRGGVGVGKSKEWWIFKKSILLGRVSQVHSFCLCKDDFEKTEN